MYKKALLLIGLLGIASAVQATPLTFGQDPTINRGNGGTGGYNQLIAATTMPGYPISSSGFVTGWEAYNAGTSAGIVASVIFTPDLANPGQYLITGMDYQTLAVGYNSFVGTSYADNGAQGSGGGSNALAAGAIFGLYNLTAKVSNTQAGATDLWGRDLDWTSGLPTVGTSLIITTFGINPPINSPTPRTYSYQVTADVPEPATLWLVGLPLAWWSASRRKRGDAAAV